LRWQKCALRQRCHILRIHLSVCGYEPSLSYQFCISHHQCHSQPFSCLLIELNALHEELKPLGFTIFGFPCNQFGKQEPGQNNEILPGLRHVRPGNGFVPNFLLFNKGDVNGKYEQDVFTFLKGGCPPVGEDFGNTDRLFWEPLKIGDIKWNFEKFLVGPEGKPVMRWHPSVNVSTVRTDIRNFLLKLYTQDLFN
uniref:Glutathione peroxidase n=1 Tax=Oryzias sinensis TaxID=183150 RepID=A0A8C7ZN67_9TELE